MHLDRTTRRMLGALLEKRFTTPEQYPLTLNALVLACNQKSNRDPEMELQEFEVEGCLRQLRIRGWITVVEREYGRAVRYSERMCEQIGLSVKEAAVMAELMLRGPQTEQELQRRCERMTSLGSVDETLSILNGLAERSLVLHLPREAGQRVARWKHLLTPPEEEGAEAGGAGVPSAAAGSAAAGVAPVAAPPGAPPFAPPGVPATGAEPRPTQLLPEAPHAVHPAAASAEDVEALRDEVLSLRAEVETLRSRLDRLEGR